MASRLTAIAVALLMLAAGCSSSGGPEVADPTTTTGFGRTTTTSTIAAIAEREGTVTYELPGEVVFPEGVAYDPRTDRFFVTSTTDGTIFVGDRATGDVEVFSEAGADGRTEAWGLAVDPERRRLWVAGGAAQTAYVYDVDSGELVANYAAADFPGSFINDVTVAPDGDAYLTDFGPRPVLFRVAGDSEDPGELEEWLDLSTTSIPIQGGPAGAFNLNGIVASEDGRYLLAVHTGEQRLYRIDRQTQEVVPASDPGEMGFGDGMVLDDTTLWVAGFSPTTQIFGVQRFELADTLDDVERGDVADTTSPTTAAQVGDRLLVVNSQIDRQESGPELPFTVSEIPAP